MNFPGTISKCLRRHPWVMALSVYAGGKGPDWLVTERLLA